ncbi:MULTISPECIES: sigma-70 family RNA polymerase sigma factor [unclassified Spirosoma]|uniref:RNA polymerase sigma factor n=1 Tax=unclassified Spirosoma TaxID=2621999 RepID=UPI000962F296|nr:MULTISPECIES: sigma-70 family RNA polymerase sigma factor [unclassified Spirosoma]MBN8822551.1 sigma-70 family RNA polymerase sigma factor [Spirosoma sp.]OJW74301.1 MAG: hypothetical protein BGO59_13025 [Spirosoma sp. 48-14]
MEASEQHDGNQSGIRPSRNDEQLCWDSFRSGNEQAFTRISVTYYRQLIHYGLKFTPNVQFVEDALQDLLIHLWVHHDSIGPTASVKFYLMKAFRHQLFKNLKRLGSEQLTDWTTDFSTPDSWVENTGISQVENQEGENTFDYLLSLVPARQREVLYLRYYQGLSVDEIAQLLVIQPQSVSNLLQRALIKLRQHWPVPVLLSLILLLFE